MKYFEKFLKTFLILSSVCHLVIALTSQTSPTVVSLKGRLPQKLQSKSTLSCRTSQIHTLSHHGFIKKSKLRENRHILFLCDVFRKTDLGIDMVANAFRGSI